MDQNNINEAAGLDLKSDVLNSELYRILIGLANEVSRNRFAITGADLEAIKGAKAASLKLMTKHFGNIIDTIEERQSNLALFNSVDFISVGYDCLPRTLLTRWGLKKTSLLGEKSGPFDLSIHPAASVAKLIESKFALYFDGGLRFDEKKNYCVHDNLGIELNHDKGREYVENDFAKLRERYQRRSATFIHKATKSERLVFVHHVDNANHHTHNEIRQLVTELRSLREGKPFAFVCLNTPPFDDDFAITLDAAEGRVINAPYPFAGYVWWKAHHTFSLRGVAFEKHLVTELKSMVSDLGWIQNKEKAA